MTKTFDIRSQMNGIAEAPGKTWFFELAAGVIDADRCIQCGTCVAACPTDSIGIGSKGLPALVKMCTGCSLCWDFCPRAGLRYETTWPERSVDGAEWRITGTSGAGLGQVRGAYSARTASGFPGAQDGGVVSSLLIALMEAGHIDGALVARPSPTEEWKAEAHVARTPDEVRASAGSFYNQTMALAHLDVEAKGLGPDARLAVVGTPCEIQGLKALQSRNWRWGKSRPEAVVLTIALLCTKSFNYEGLMLTELRDRRGVDLSDVGRVDILHGKLMVDSKDGRRLVEEPIRDFHGAALKGCDECADFLGHAADISVGSVGSADGFSSVLVRTPAGEKAFAEVTERLEVRDLDRPEALVKLENMDKKTAFSALARPFDPDRPMFIDFAEHVSHYEGTDRAPVWADDSNA
ncbi:MAG TPA: Coenzyme F420 hydrogenase/dehydrogenase, beta subunit C-terminal domain [Acidimicrobiales bacterium]|nr:Coenzyme F420 hydrogenase/dehydrogenase, beta subunit C-terminal domain [Acidimicrobiales bacterium]